MTPRTRRLRYTRAARADLVEIAVFIVRSGGSRSTARRFAAELDETCRRLAASAFATMGRARPELRPDMRSATHKNYVIFFRYLAEAVEIVNVLEGHRDLDGYYERYPS